MLRQMEHRMEQQVERKTEPFEFAGYIDARQMEQQVERKTEPL